MTTAAPMTRWTTAWLAGKFGVFTIWVLIGFEQPFDGRPLTANVVSKVLAFATALSLFIRREYLRRTRRPATR